MTPSLQDHDLVGHGHRLDLVVGDVDHGRAEPAVQGDQLAAHLDPELGVEVGQRLVEQERLGLLDDGAADGDALALAAGELVRPALRGDGSICRISAALRDARWSISGLGSAQVLQAEAQVLLDVHVRVERVGLEHHRHAARRRQQVVAALAVDVDLAGGDLLEAGDHAQQRGLAAAGRADEDGEGAVVDGEVDAVDDFERLEALPDIA